MSASISSVLLAAAAGAVLGGIFFGGLWWTLRHAERRRIRIASFMDSFALRSVLLLAGLWWVGRRDLSRMLACVVGILAARAIFARLARWRTNGDEQRQEVG